LSTSEIPIAGSNQLQNSIQQMMRRLGLFGNVSVIPVNDNSGGVNVTINASVDRRQDMLKVVRGY